MILDDRGFDRIYEGSVESAIELNQHLFVNEIPLRTITNSISIALYPWEAHTDARAQAAKEDSARLQDTP